MESNNINKRKRKTSVSSRRILIVVVALLLLCVAIVIFLKYPPKSGMAKPSSVQAAAPDVINTPAEQPPQVSAAQPPAAAQPVAENADAREKPKDPPPAKKNPKPKDEKVVQDPLSRVALSLVGVDPAAEDYWLGAVFDPSLPQSERQDLVDDLNEQGLPDPKH